MGVVHNELVVALAAQWLVQLVLAAGVEADVSAAALDGGV